MHHSEKSQQRALILISLMISLIAGLTFPIITDESYYVDWARRSGWPRLGFFDHPPMVSWIAGFVNLHQSVTSARIAVWTCHLISIFFVWKTAKRLIPNQALSATLLVASTLGAMANGFLLTPDVGVITFWIIALHEAVAAIQSNPKRWLSAGLMTGVGLWSKYTMVLIGPVFLWAMLRDNRRQLLTPWPYLGGLICALVIAPHIWWQSQMNWITFRFQFGHGFSVSQTIDSGSTLPEAQEPTEEDDLARKLYGELFAAMNNVSGFSEAIKPPKPEKSKLEKSVQYSGDFLGGVAGLWGVYSIAFLFAIIRRPKRINISGIGDKGMGAIIAASLFPLIFFGIISPFSKIEANWPAMHMAPMAIWICSHWNVPLRITKIAVLAHAFAVASLVFVLSNPNSIPGARNNRILLESKGFESLGGWVSKEFSGRVVGVDSYQLKSAIRYYAPNVDVAQWPGFTRGSEYTRGDDDDKNAERKLLSQDYVTIISLKPHPKLIEGFVADSISGMRVCPDGSIGVFSVQNPRLPCEKGLRELWISSYKNQNPR